MPPRNDFQNEFKEEGENFDMQFFPHYHNEKKANMTVIEEIISSDGKIERKYKNGKK
jgi:hypothetical protein